MTQADDKAKAKALLEQAVNDIREPTQAELAALKKLDRKEQREEQPIVREFVRAVKQGDRTALFNLLGKIDEYTLFGWRRAFQALVRKVKNDELDPEMRAAWLGICISGGDHIRQEVNDDRLHVRGLRVLLPPYTGPALTLYRGDGAWNRRRRTYGPSWSSSETVARDHAEGYWRASEGGSVLLSTAAPAEAIICAPWQHNDRYAEGEYLVDRSRLKRVTVLQRYSQVDVTTRREPK